MDDKIVIAEDSSTQAEELKYFLEKYGYHVIVAKNGKEALLLVNKYNPSLVISDVMMPQMNGYELSKRLKSDQKTKDIPIILLTSLAGTEDLLQSVSCFADSFITKPYSESYLITHIKKTLELKKLNIGQTSEISMEVSIGNEIRKVKSNPGRMMTMLISAYEAAIYKNNELIQSQNKLNALNDFLMESEAKLKLQSELLKNSNAELENRTINLEQQKDGLEIEKIAIEKYQIDLEKASEELRLSSKYKSEFLANMSHELRTPLNSLLLLSKHLGQNETGNLSTRQIEDIETIHNGGQDLLLLINDIMDLSKVEAGKLTMSMQDTEIDQIISSMKNQFTPIAEDKKLTFTINKDNNICHRILTDRQRTEQILKNLLSNAFKFTDNGSVMLNIYTPKKNIKFIHSNLKHENSIAFSVTDTGVGIAPEKQKAIFEAFQQSDGSISRKYGGTGLGLTISKELTKLLGGEIHIKSQLEKGSSFTLYLPCKSVIDENKDVKKINSESTNTIHDTIHDVNYSMHKAEEIFKNKMILLVDDDVKNVYALSGILSQYGMSVIMADNGQVALDKLKENPDIELVLMDIMMPVMDGYEATRRIREIPKNANLPIIAITAKAMSEDKAKAIEAGANDYLTKPVNIDQLITAMRTWLWKK